MIDIGIGEWVKEDTINSHVPVMLNEALEYLNPQEGGIFLDGTLGAGGHAEAVLKKVGASGKFIGIDKDETALKLAREKLKEFASQIYIFQDDFKNLKHIVHNQKINYVNGILLDLGISSMQLDDPCRGFSLRADGPLDMRMNQSGSRSASDLVNTLSEQDISLILKNYGEERFHNRIARKLVSERSLRPITTTAELRQIVMKAIPSGRSYTRIHPATRTFQALRIAVNGELESLSNFFDEALDVLAVGGRMVVIAFHSLEDRLVKEKFRQWQKDNKARILTKKPIMPGDEEVESNPRARSARLRAIERV